MAPPASQSANKQQGSHLWLVPLLTSHPLLPHPYLHLSHLGHPSLSFRPLATVFSIPILCCPFGLHWHSAARMVWLKMKLKPHRCLSPDVSRVGSSCGLQDPGMTRPWPVSPRLPHTRFFPWHSVVLQVHSRSSPHGSPTPASDLLT